MSETVPLPPRIEKLVIDGYVLDDNEQWVPLRDMVEKERLVRKRLERGEVFVDGRWMGIAEALVLSAEAEQTPMTTPVRVEMPESSAVPGQAPERRAEAFEPPVVSEPPLPVPVDTPLPPADGQTQSEPQGLVIQSIVGTVNLGEPEPIDAHAPSDGAAAGSGDLWDIVPWYRKKWLLVGLLGAGAAIVCAVVFLVFLR